jgi:hypothetical protein
MTAKSPPARLSALGLLCVAGAIGFGVDQVGDYVVARAETNSLLATLAGLVLGDEELCAQAGKALEMRMCLKRTQIDGTSAAGRSWFIREVVDQRLSLSVSICERQSRLCVHL